MTRRLCICALALTLPLAAKDKKILGAALAKVQSYCVDTSALPSAEADQVEALVRSESKPGKLLTRLPWKLYPDCREADSDAVIKVQFPVLRKIGITLGVQPDPGDADDDYFQTNAILRVGDAVSAKLLYEVEADPLNNKMINGPGNPQTVQRYNAMYGAFWKLVEDVRLVAQSAKK